MTTQSRRDFLKKTGAAASALAVSARAETPASASPKPNVVLFYFDDLDFDEIGVYDPVAFPTYTGAKQRGLFTESMNPWLAYFEATGIHTPHIDSLARDGVRFNSFYVTSTLCSPSRYSLLTGRYASRSSGVCADYPPGVQANVVQNAELGPSEQNIAKLLKAQGYTTGMVGKWHNSAWDGPYGGRVSGIDPNADPRDPDVVRKIRDAYDRGVAYIRETHGFDFAERIYLQNKEALGIPKALQVHNMEWLVEGALEFIEAAQSGPFFLYFASPAPHGWVGSGDFLKTDPCATPAGMLEHPPAGMPPREDTAKRARQAGATGRLMEATWMDDAVGAILNRLDDLGLADNTLVLFVSDHQNRGKETLYEAARVPALARWPRRIRPGLQVDGLCANIDVVPTVLDACGAIIPRDTVIDGHSFLPLLGNNATSEPWRDQLMLEICYAKAVVADGWKYIALRFPPQVLEQVREAEPDTYAWNGTAQRYQEDTPWFKKGEVNIPYGANRDFPAYFEYDQLYNLKDDPYEQHNLVRENAYQEHLASMRRRLAVSLKDLPHTFGEFKA